MKSENTLDQSYLLLLEFLLMAKQQVFALGAEHGMSGMQVIALLLVEQPRPMHSFKQLFNCDASNVTGIIDGLQQRKLVARYEHPEDRRIKMVKLLSKGQQLRTTLLRQLAASDNVLARLSPDDLATFMSLVRQITQA